MKPADTCHLNLNGALVAVCFAVIAHIQTPFLEIRPARIAEALRGHWSVENKNHWHAFEFDLRARMWFLPEP